MKLFTTIFLLAASFSTVCNAQSFKMTGHVEGLSDTTAIFTRYMGKHQTVIDTVSIDSQGNFTYNPSTALPIGLYVLSFNTNEGPKAMDVIVDNASFSLDADVDNILKTAKFSGEKENSLYYKNLLTERSIGEQMRELQNQIKNSSDAKSKARLEKKLKKLEVQTAKIRSKVIKKYADSFLATLYKASTPVTIPASVKGEEARKRYFRDHYFDNVDFSNATLINSPVVEEKIDYYLDNLVLQVPDSINEGIDVIAERAIADSSMYKYVMTHIVDKYESSDVMGMNDVIWHINKNYWLTGKMWWVDKKEESQVKRFVNMHEWTRLYHKPMNLQLKDTLGVVHDLYQVPAKYTFVYFWSATCGHCKRTNPKVWEMYEEFKPKGLEIYAIAINRDLKPFTMYLAEHPFTWINVTDVDNTSFARTYYNVRSTPTFYLLDENKRIVLKDVPLETVEEFLEDELGEE